MNSNRNLNQKEHIPNWFRVRLMQIWVCFQNSALAPKYLCIRSVFQLRRNQYYKIKARDWNVFIKQLIVNKDLSNYILLRCSDFLIWLDGPFNVQKLKEDSRWKQTWAPHIWGRVLPSLAAPSCRSPSRRLPSRLRGGFEKSINTNKFISAK